MKTQNAWPDETCSPDLGPKFAKNSGMTAQNPGSTESAHFESKAAAGAGDDTEIRNFPGTHSPFDTATPLYSTNSADRSIIAPSDPAVYSALADEHSNLGMFSAAASSVSRLRAPSAIISPGDLLAHSASDPTTTLPPLNYALLDSNPLNMHAPLNVPQSGDQLPSINQASSDLSPNSPAGFSQAPVEDPPTLAPPDKLDSIPLSASDEVELASLQKNRDELSQALATEAKRISELEAELARNRRVWQDVEKRIQEETFRLEGIVDEHPVLKRQIAELENGKYATYKRELSQGLAELSQNYWQYGLRDHGDLTTNFFTALSVIETALTAIDKLQSKRAMLETSIDQLVMRQHNLRVHLIDLIHDGSVPSPFDDLMTPSASSHGPNELDDSHYNPD